MKTKAIVFTSPKVARLQERDLRELGEKDVLVKLAVSSISTGTERANLIGEVNVSVNSNATVRISKPEPENASFIRLSVMTKSESDQLPAGIVVVTSMVSSL